MRALSHLCLCFASVTLENRNRIDALRAKQVLFSYAPLLRKAVPFLIRFSSRFELRCEKLQPIGLSAARVGRWNIERASLQILFFGV
ncbi:hypothetical protein Y032_0030g2017 [Ancylostoma ceylanicum]|uniref:Uncharacterized protein n=1 Tax=Ancylostoma ceylanicum TaxID=53326 RepID=A0A016USC5_9BILA|nr:hypothetical protein Y032_0030g2017 [Ancylostoma ceylanicum]